MKTREIIIAGYTVEIYTFGKRSFYYPCFNPNAEYPVSKKGFQEMYSYLRLVRWGRKMMEETIPLFRLRDNSLFSTI